MCICLVSTRHPDYPLILLSNRDEFLNRPTAPADWWQQPNGHVLGGRDLQREEQGTWLGLTKDGRLAVLTNFREEGQEIAKNKSRGGIPKAYLTSPSGQVESDEDFAHRLINDVGIHDVGGFTLLFGRLTSNSSFSGLSIISNRTSSAAGLVKVAEKPDETHGLSNSHFGDLTWPKVVHGEHLLSQAIKASVFRQDPQEKLIDGLFDVLSVDTMPKRQMGEDWNTYARQLRNSIFIPSVGGEPVAAKPADEVAAARDTDRPGRAEVKVGELVYGTQKQTVVLVDRKGTVTFTERTLFDEAGSLISRDSAERRFHFNIDGWGA